MTGGRYRLRVLDDPEVWLEVNVAAIGDTADARWQALGYCQATQRHYSGAGPTAEHALDEARADYAARWRDGRPRVAITGDARDKRPAPDLSGLVEPL